MFGPHLGAVGKHLEVLWDHLSKRLGLGEAVLEDPDLTAAMRADFEQRYAPLAPMLLGLAQRHNLRIEKYRYAQPNWSFHFRIGDTGRGHLQVMRPSAALVVVAGSREEFDFDRPRRYTKKGGLTLTKLPVDSPDFEKTVKAALEQIVKVPLSELEPDDPPMHSTAGWRTSIGSEPLVRLD
jgi:hypothetical protein